MSIKKILGNYFYNRYGVLVIYDGDNFKVIDKDENILYVGDNYRDCAKYIKDVFMMGKKER